MKDSIDGQESPIVHQEKAPPLGDVRRLLVHRAACHEEAATINTVFVARWTEHLFS